MTAFAKVLMGVFVGVCIASIVFTFLDEAMQQNVLRHLSIALVKVNTAIDAVKLFETTLMTTTSTSTTTLTTAAVVPVVEEKPEARDRQLTVVRGRVRKRYLLVHLHATRTSGGVGNAAFEVLAALGLAKLTNRRIAIAADDVPMADRMSRMAGLLPNLFEDFEFMETNLSRVLTIQGHFAQRGNLPNLRQTQNEPVLHTNNAYLQSFKYFDTLSYEEIRRRLEFPAAHRRLAREQLPANFTNGNMTKLCVHVRRGNFLTSFPHVASETNFTTGAIRYLAKNVMAEPFGIVMLGNDPLWELGIIVNLSLPNPSHVVMYDSANPDTIDWIISQEFCDVVLISASASTYGWFLGYLSKGGRVFYYEKALQERAAHTLVHQDFFPPQWTPLRLINGTEVIAIRPEEAKGVK